VKDLSRLDRPILDQGSEEPPLPLAKALPPPKIEDPQKSVDRGRQNGGPITGLADFIVRANHLDPDQGEFQAYSQQDQTLIRRQAEAVDFRRPPAADGTAWFPTPSSIHFGLVCRLDLCRIFSSIALSSVLGWGVGVARLPARVPCRRQNLLQPVVSHRLLARGC